MFCMIRRWAILSILAILSIIACEDDARVIEYREDYFLIGDLLHVSETEIIFERIEHAKVGVEREPHVEGEKVIGEPFFDVNGDGVYTIALDYFAIVTRDTVYLDTIYLACTEWSDTVCQRTVLVDSADSWDFRIIDTIRNQDLNRNGRHDGPEGWYPPDTRVPYDDLNNNGQYDNVIEYWEYQDGIPFFDANDNNRYDSLLPFNFGLAALNLQEVSSDTILVEARSLGLSGYDREDDFARFVSDSGITYGLSLIHFGGGNSAIYSFRLDPSGLWHTSLSLSPVSRGIPVLPPGNIVPEENEAVRLSDSVVVYRSILFDQGVDLLGDRVNGVVHVRIDSLVDSTRTYPNSVTVPLDLEYFFSPESGLVAIFGSVWQNDLYLKYAVNRRIDTLPLPMLRIEPGGSTANRP